MTSTSAKVSVARPDSSIRTYRPCVPVDFVPDARCAGKAFNSGSILEYIVARSAGSETSGVAETRSRSEPTDLVPRVQALSAEPSTVMSATKPICRRNGALAPVASFSRSARTIDSSFASRAASRRIRSNTTV
jgi:hypothetical protein